MPARTAATRGHPRLLRDEREPAASDHGQVGEADADLVERGCRERPGNLPHARPPVVHGPVRSARRAVAGAAAVGGGAGGRDHRAAHRALEDAAVPIAVRRRRCARNPRPAPAGYTRSPCRDHRFTRVAGCVGEGDRRAVAQAGDAGTRCTCSTWVAARRTGLHSPDLRRGLRERGFGFATMDALPTHVST